MCISFSQINLRENYRNDKCTFPDVLMYEQSWCRPNLITCWSSLFAVQKAPRKETTSTFLGQVQALLLRAGTKHLRRSAPCMPHVDQHSGPKLH